METRTTLQFDGRGRHLRAVEVPAAPLLDSGVPTPPGGVSRVTLRAITEESDRRLQTLMTFYRIAEESEYRVQTIIAAGEPMADYAPGEEILQIPSASLSLSEAPIEPAATDFKLDVVATAPEPVSWTQTNTVDTDELIAKYADNRTPSNVSTLGIIRLGRAWADHTVETSLAA